MILFEPLVVQALLHSISIWRHLNVFIKIQVKSAGFVRLNVLNRVKEVDCHWQFYKVKLQTTSNLHLMQNERYCSCQYCHLQVQVIGEVWMANIFRLYTLFLLRRAQQSVDRKYRRGSKPQQRRKETPISRNTRHTRVHEERKYTR